MVSLTETADIQNATAANVHLRQLSEHVNLLAEVKSLHDKLDAETEFCRNLSRSMQVTHFSLKMPFRVGVAIQQSTFGSGDVFDAIELPAEKLCIYLADCAGPGTPSGCLISVAVRHAVNHAVHNCRIESASQMISTVNQRLLDCQFPQLPSVAMACVVIDKRNESIQIARAGLPAPLTVSKTNERILWNVPGPVLGIAKADYHSEHWRFSAGDRLILSTSNHGLETYSFDVHTDSQLLAEQLIHQIPQKIENTILAIQQLQVD